MAANEVHSDVQDYTTEIYHPQIVTTFGTLEIICT